MHPELAQWNNPDAVGPSGKGGDPNKGVELPRKGARGYLAHSQATVGPWEGTVTDWTEATHPFL